MTLWDEFARDPFHHPVIPYVASAGYRFGVSPVVQEFGVSVQDFGARGDGRHDDAEAINRAIAQVGAVGGGTVRIPAGRYLVRDVIRVGADNVVLRGAGSGRTTLVPGAPLEELVGVSRSRYGSHSSAWSWSGGLVWVCPSGRLAGLLDRIRQGGRPWEGWDDRESGGLPELARVVRAARRGDLGIDVDCADLLFPGRRVLVRWCDGGDHSLFRHLCGDVPGASHYPWETKTKLVSYLPLIWPVRIRSVQDRHVRLAQPLPSQVREQWQVTLAAPNQVITGAGVEGFTVELPPAPVETHLQDKGFNGVAFQCAWDCWARDVVVKGGENGILLVSSKNVTVSRTRVVGVSRHHSYVCREQSHDNLFTDFAIRRAPWDGVASFHHGINVEGLSSGNVWTHGRMEAGTFDSHRGLPFGNVRTNIEIFNDGVMSGSRDAGPRYGARFVHWNVRVLNGRAAGIDIHRHAPWSATVGVSVGRDGEELPPSDIAGDLRSLKVPPGEIVVNISDLYQAQRLLPVTWNGDVR